MKIRYLGHSSFEIEVGKLKILTDPYYYSLSQGKRRLISPVKPQQLYDYILISHEHFDHCYSQLIDEIFSEKTKIITTKEAASTLNHPCHTLNVGMEYVDTTEQGSEKIRVEALRAKHPQSENPIGFYFYVKEEEHQIPVYFAGDTDHYPEMGDIAPPFLAFIPIGGKYTADVDTGSDIAALIRPQHIIPMHYNTWEEIQADLNEFILQAKNKTMATKVHPLQPGQSIDIPYTPPPGAKTPPVSGV